MAKDYIRVEKSGGKWVVRAGGAVIGESSAVLLLHEGNLPVVAYFPRDDIAMAFLDRSDSTTHCPHKGDASYYSIETKSVTIDDAAWSYEDPIPAAAAIKGYLAFVEDEVTVEEI
ncbi:hypothetical protein OCGS_0541 [Oceaniovalibus guishaninsula JLT2003]|uniref:DUF427 domain-containing protein n=1 Tax=Oceaniovalibus guishaninsula JLT2003 TaxID=1231392 RepID=K2GS47_9RHOB|nr:DUF427 domain-containing protein [Oceaniovalibus guishaninsula]EKE45451.1 hypothetical protein OCGS_0541 [Oceaniovalibus guishaninsula JLT2003]